MLRFAWDGERKLAVQHTNIVNMDTDTQQLAALRDLLFNATVQAALERFGVSFAVSALGEGLRSWLRALTLDRHHVLDAVIDVSD